MCTILPSRPPGLCPSGLPGKTSHISRTVCKKKDEKKKKKKKKKKREKKKKMDGKQTSAPQTKNYVKNKKFTINMTRRSAQKKAGKKDADKDRNKEKTEKSRKNIFSKIKTKYNSYVCCKYKKKVKEFLKILTLVILIAILTWVVTLENRKMETKNEKKQNSGSQKTLEEEKKRFMTKREQYLGGGEGKYFCKKVENFIYLAKRLKKADNRTNSLATKLVCQRLKAESETFCFEENINLSQDWNRARTSSEGLAAKKNISLSQEWNRARTSSEGLAAKKNISLSEEWNRAGTSSERPATKKRRKELNKKFNYRHNKINRFTSKNKKKRKSFLPWFQTPKSVIVGETLRFSKRARSCLSNNKSAFTFSQVELKDKKIVICVKMVKNRKIFFIFCKH